MKQRLKAVLCAAALHDYLLSSPSCVVIFVSKFSLFRTMPTSLCLESLPGRWTWTASLSLALNWDILSKETRLQLYFAAKLYIELVSVKQQRLADTLAGLINPAVI